MFDFPEAPIVLQPKTRLLFVIFGMHQSYPTTLLKEFFFFFCWIDKLCWHLLGAAHFKIQSSINNKCPPFLVGDSTCSESSDLCHLYHME